MRRGGGTCKFPAAGAYGTQTTGKGAVWSMERDWLRRAGQTAMEQLDLPGDIPAGVPRVELIGDRELYMTQHRGVLAYSEETVDIGGQGVMVRVLGTELRLLAMSGGELRLRGQIAAVELHRQGGADV